MLQLSFEHFTEFIVAENARQTHLLHPLKRGPDRWSILASAIVPQIPEIRC